MAEMSEKKEVLGLINELCSQSWGEAIQKMLKKFKVDMEQELSSGDGSVDSSDEQVRLPPLEKESISSVSRKKNREDIFTEQPLYCHWYAVALYNLVLDLKEKIKDESAREVEVQFRGVPYKINCALLEEMSKVVHKFCVERRGSTYPTHGYLRDPVLRGCELTFSLIFSHVLSKLVIPGTCSIVLHQGPIRKREGTSGNPEVADLIGCSDDGQYVFVSDLKNNDLDWAEKETALCAKHASLPQNLCTHRYRMVVGLASTRCQSTLWLYIIADNVFWAVPIGLYNPWDKTLLASITIAIANLAGSPITYQGLRNPVPFMNILTPLKKVLTCRIFLDEKSNTVCKLFDRSQKTLRPNIDLMTSVGIRDVRKENLTTDGEYFYVQYSYYQGSHEPFHMRQYCGIVVMLHKIHEAGYVHCDIRMQNLIFDVNQVDSYIIDYDLARKDGEGSVYPIGYYYSKEIRHKGAKEGELVKKEHDRYALKLVIQQHYQSKESSIIAEMLDSKCSLLDIAELLKKN